MSRDSSRDDHTRTLPDGPDPASDPTRPTAHSEAPSSASLDGARFAPGTILAGRYRLVAMLGRGGMGEVYRAEDLKLGETVALKFLPEELSLDAGALARFHHEVRVARQIAHRNVCRVHDIGEAEGWHFLTMEYIDGEDLSVLLRRIGRLPEDKATTLAREICAGLAAAHEAGILHRDLKPANVMIDGRGHAKITDFGLATLQEELREDAEHFAGTPAYMAPEQFRGEETTKRTDLYSLGLVLYEMFTGESAFPAENWPQIVARGGRESDPTPPSSRVESLDPMVERAILRCLRDDPQKRPGSALEVAASLPGGDPLRAALEAGETPSPEMVAAGGETGRALSRRLGTALLAVVVLSVLAHQYLGRYSLLSLVGPEKSTPVLEDRAKEMLEELGWDVPMGAHAGSYAVDRAAMGFRGEWADDLEAWRSRSGVRPLLTYWYRAAPDDLSVESGGAAKSLYRPTPALPAPAPGHAFLRLDPEGRLLALRLDPLGEAPPGEPDWSPLWELSGLEESRLEPVDPPPLHGGIDLPVHDRRWAWRATGGEGENPALVAAASFGSWPVAFRLRYEREEAGPVLGDAPPQAVIVGFFMLLALGVTMAVHHVRSGRSDGRGALRLALFVGVVTLFANLALAGGADFRKMISVLASASYRAMIVWILYLAIEPPIRRRAPRLLVSWTRLLRGNWRDPAVGADVLRAVAVCALYYVLHFAQHAWRVAAGDAIPYLPFSLGGKLSGLGPNLWYLAAALFVAVAGALCLAVFYSLLLVGVRRSDVAAILLVAVVAGAILLGGLSFDMVYFALLLALLAALLARHGVLAGAAFAMVSVWIHGATHTLSPDDWWAWPQSWLPAGMVLLLAFLAYRSAIGEARPSRLAR